MSHSYRFKYINMCYSKSFDRKTKYLSNSKSRIDQIQFFSKNPTLRQPHTISWGMVDLQKKIWHNEKERKNQNKSFWHAWSICKIFFPLPQWLTNNQLIFWPIKNAKLEGWKLYACPSWVTWPVDTENLKTYHLKEFQFWF